MPKGDSNTTVDADMSFDEAMTFWLLPDEADYTWQEAWEKNHPAGRPWYFYFRDKFISFVDSQSLGVVLGDLSENQLSAYKPVMIA